MHNACQATLMHAGREPKNPGYHCDPHTLCAADKIERWLRDYPQLQCCIPHLGAVFTRGLQGLENDTQIPKEGREFGTTI